MDAKFLVRLKKGGLNVSRVQPSNGWSEIGSAQLRRGFGEDADATFLNLFIQAMVAVELKPHINPKLEPAHPNAIQSTWLATVNGLIASAPADLFRRDRGYVHLANGARQDEKEYLDRPQPLYLYLFAEYVNPFADLLVPQHTPAIYSLDYLTKEHPFVTPADAIHTQPGWRYQVMAQLLWYELGPNLRTLEMVDTNAIWRRLNRYFWQIQNLYGHWELMRGGTQRRERASFILAIYERTLNLLHERWIDAPRYRQAISHRPSTNKENIDATLFIPSTNGSLASLAEARTVRVQAYDELLFATLSNCFASLRNLA